MTLNGFMSHAKVTFGLLHAELFHKLAFEPLALENLFQDVLKVCWCPDEPCQSHFISDGMKAIRR